MKQSEIGAQFEAGHKLEAGELKEARIDVQGDAGVCNEWLFEQLKNRQLFGLKTTFRLLQPGHLPNHILVQQTGIQMELILQ